MLLKIEQFSQPFGLAPANRPELVSRMDEFQMISEEKFDVLQCASFGIHDASQIQTSAKSPRIEVTPSIAADTALLQAR